MSNYLIHYNHNHDALGRFARSAGGSISRGTKSVGSNTTRKLKSAQRISKKKKTANNVEVAKKQKGSKSNNTKLSEADRERLVREGSVKEITANKDRLSNRELETAVNRLEKEKINRMDLEKKLSDLNSQANKQQTEAFIDKIANAGEKLKKANNAADRTVDAYNTMAKIHNSLSDKDHQWTLLDGKPKQGQTSREIESIIRSADPWVVFANRSKMSVDEYKKANDRIAQDIRNAKMREDVREQNRTNETNKKKYSETMKEYRKKEQEERLSKMPIYTAETQEEYERLKRRKGNKAYDSRGNEWTVYY